MLLRSSLSISNIQKKTLLFKLRKSSFPSVQTAEAWCGDLTVPVSGLPVLAEEMVTSPLGHAPPPLLSLCSLLSLVPLVARLHLSAIEKDTNLLEDHSFINNIRYFLGRIGCSVCYTCKENLPSSGPLLTEWIAPPVWGLSSLVWSPTAGRPGRVTSTANMWQLGLHATCDESYSTLLLVNWTFSSRKEISESLSKKVVFI